MNFPRFPLPFSLGSDTPLRSILFHEFLHLSFLLSSPGPDKFDSDSYVIDELFVGVDGLVDEEYFSPIIRGSWGIGSMLPKEEEEEPSSVCCFCPSLIWSLSLESYASCSFLCSEDGGLLLVIDINQLKDKSKPIQSTMRIRR